MLIKFQCIIEIFYSQYKKGFKDLVAGFSWVDGTQDIDKLLDQLTNWDAQFPGILNVNFFLKIQTILLKEKHIQPAEKMFALGIQMVPKITLSGF